jgi:4-amino-4-deoxy-L-arabinose transferase-like glycosyltransferase
MAGGVAHPPPSHAVLQQVTRWWHEAESAVQAGEQARARRLFRWILLYCPDDEEAWLWSAGLTPKPTEQRVILQRAHVLHPNSARIQAALRAVRTQQLESSVGELKALPGRVRYLPDNRFVAYNGNATGKSTPAPTRPLPARRLPRLPSMRSLLDLSTLDVAAWLAFLLPLSAYLLTTCSTVYNLDSAEFSAAAHVLGIVRATGYPLYLLLGKAFTLLLPLGNIAFRLNVMSALCAAGTVAILYQIVRYLTRQRAAALAASLLFAFSYYFWAQAVVAEVYTLHTLLMTTLFWLLLLWERRHDDRLLVVSGLLLGLSFGNHMSTLLVVPAVLAFLLLVGKREFLRPRRLLLFLVPFVVGLGIYLYIPLRYLAQPAFNYAGHYDAMGRFIPLDMTQPANIWWLISGQGFRDLMFDYAPAELAGEIGQAAYRLWGTFLGIGLVPGLLGIWVQARRRPQHLLLFGLTFLANLAFFVNYRVVDKETMFLPAYLVGAIWVGEGYGWLIRWVQGRRGLTRHRSPAWAWGLVALALVGLFVNWSLVDVHADTRARDRASAALETAGPQAIVFGWWTSAPPMHYQQLVEGQRPDVLVINRFLIGADEMYTLIDRSLGQRPVYVMELDEGLINAYRPVPVGPMFELAPRELAEIEP